MFFFLYEHSGSPSGKNTVGIKILNVFFFFLLVWTQRPPQRRKCRVNSFDNSWDNLYIKICYTRFQLSFYLWRIGPVLKYYEVPKYHNQDCTFNSSIFPCLNFGYCCTVKLPSSWPWIQVKDCHNSPLQTWKKIWFLWICFKGIALSLWRRIFYPRRYF